MSCQKRGAFRGPPRCSAITVHPSGGLAVNVSLLGHFAITLPLDQASQGVNIAWVSDPLNPTASAHGPLEQVVARRLGLV